MLSEMGMGDNAPVNILEDNQACISVGTRDVVSPKLKHIDIRYHYVRTMVQEGKIRIIYCPTFHQAAVLAVNLHPVRAHIRDNRFRRSSGQRIACTAS